MIDSSSLMLNQIRPPVEENGHDGMEIIKKQMDEEQLTGDESSYDMAFSCLGLHWINDLPSVFRRVLHLLKNDAPFIGKDLGIYFLDYNKSVYFIFLGAMFASDTLYELRVSLQLAETEREGVRTRIIFI